jgi:hypothetical protein
MGLFLLLIIVLLLAVAGVLGFVLKVAAGVALGLFLGVALVAALVSWRVRRFLYGSRPRWRRVRSSSRIEVLDPSDRRPHA